MTAVNKIPECHRFLEKQLRVSGRSQLIHSPIQIKLILKKTELSWISRLSEKFLAKTGEFPLSPSQCHWQNCTAHYKCQRVLPYGKNSKPTLNFHSILNVGDKKSYSKLRTKKDNSERMRRSTVYKGQKQQ